MIIKIMFVTGAYLLGSVPFGLIYSHWFEARNLREHGSGNIGATNVLRNFGWLAGLTVLTCDVLKGAGPVYGAWVVFSDRPIMLLFVGIAAIIGHIYSIFLGFDGGKGVATSAGVFAVLLPKPFLSAVIVFVIGVGITRYMSVGSLAGAVTLPVAGVYWNDILKPAVLAGMALALMVFWQHTENIRRLLRGEEETFF